jgi:hypothetical protein
MGYSPPWETTSSLIGQETLRIFIIRKVSFPRPQQPFTNPYLSQSNRVRVPPFYFFKILFNISLPLKPRFSDFYIFLSLSLPLTHMCHMSCRTHFSWSPKQYLARGKGWTVLSARGSWLSAVLFVGRPATRLCWTSVWQEGWTKNLVASREEEQSSLVCTKRAEC